MADLQTQTQALLSDAKTWHQAADELEKPGTATESLTLDGATDVTGLGQRMGTDSSYEAARIKMLELMGQAMTYFNDLAETLLDVSEMYERNEQTHSETLAKLRDALGESRVL